MEWRIIVPVLCLIGIIHVPGNAAQADNTNSTSNTNSTNSTSNTNTVYRFSLSFTINDTFRTEYSDINNDTTSALKKNITSQVEPLYKSIINFIGFNISQFRSGSIVTYGELQFSNGSKPTVPDLTQILKNGNFTFTMIKDTINITDITPPPAPATTPAPAVTNQTVAPTTAAPAKVTNINLVFKIVQDFKDIYANLSHPETNELSTNITSECSAVYKRRFSKFLKMSIQKFSKGSIVVDSVLQFDSTNGSSAPNTSEVIDTLTAAIANGSFSFKVDNTSIDATVIPDTSVTTAAANTSVTTQVPAALDLAEYNISFKMNEAFSDDLSNMTSAPAIKLVTNITTELNKFCKGFRNFNRLLIKRFRSGSILVDALLGLLKNGTNPTALELARGLAEAVRNGTVQLTIDPKSISVTDPTGQTANRSPVLASMLTALWMTLASLLFSAVMH